MANEAWGGALTALGGLTLLSGVAAHQDGVPLVNVATVLGGVGTAGGVYLLTRPSRPVSGRSRSRGGSHNGGVTSHNRRSRYRGH